MPSSKSYHKHPSHFPRQDCSPLCSLKERGEKSSVLRRGRQLLAFFAALKGHPGNKSDSRSLKKPNKQLFFPRTTLCSVTVIFCIRTKTQAGWHLIVHFLLLFSNFVSFLARMHECLKIILQFLDSIPPDILQSTNSPWTKVWETPRIRFPTLMSIDSPWGEKHLPCPRHLGFSLWDLGVTHCNAWRHLGCSFALPLQPSQKSFQSKNCAGITYFCLPQEHQNFQAYFGRIKFVCPDNSLMMFWNTIDALGNHATDALLASSSPLFHIL